MEKRQPQPSLVFQLWIILTCNLWFVEIFFLRIWEMFKCRYAACWLNCSVDPPLYTRKTSIYKAAADNSNIVYSVLIGPERLKDHRESVDSKLWLYSTWNAFTNWNGCFTLTKGLFICNVRWHFWQCANVQHNFYKKRPFLFYPI